MEGSGMESKASEAVDLFQAGCACSQAILAVYGELFGLDRDSAMRIAAGFAGRDETGRDLRGP